MVRADDLYALGLRLMDQAVTMPDRREAAYAFRDGLIIALLITTALRRKNLAALVIGTHVQRVGERYRLSITAEETKARKPIELLLSDRLTPYFECYLADYRLRLNGADGHNGLWSSTKGGSLGPNAIYDAVCRRTREAFGKAIYLHLFRDIAATAIGDDAPGAMHLARDLLGHTKLVMTDKYYRQADRMAALRRHTALLETLRAKNETMVRADGQAGQS